MGTRRYKLLPDFKKYANTEIPEDIEDVLDLIYQPPSTRAGNHMYEARMQASMRVNLSTVNRESFLWTTISPRPEIKWEPFRDKIFDFFVPKECWTCGVYVFEQRATIDEEPYGFHVHCLIKLSGKRKPSSCKGDITTAFKNYGFAYTVPNMNKDDAAVRLNYMVGTKSDPDKQHKQSQDVNWREGEGLQPFYQWGDRLLVGAPN